ncbi:MAG: 1-deoxy-D-xylulose-5-phosphate reductoisomerase [Candidatus Eisenbacteria bacterium]|nr:1-deoxy-D-xylulose-5-phosphate reductoisomerase [Candidatus Eisenbacteria bacterium]
MAHRKKRIALLGSTGSIGRGVLDVVAKNRERFEIASLSAWTSLEQLSRQVDVTGAGRAVVGPGGAARLEVPSGVTVDEGAEALEALASDPDVDLVVNAIVGSSGLRPTVAALTAGKRLALANKESLVAAGELVMGLAREGGGELLPVDSEHSSIFRCLRGTPGDEVDSLVLTASGGPLRDRPLEELREAGLDEVLAHPTWEMGEKVTVDSASLANKAMEVIEARWLFDMPFDRIGAVIHRESIVHSLVRLVDGSMLAHLGQPDMRVPIQYALFYPDVPERAFEYCGLAELGALHFEPVDERRYPCFGLILQAGREGGTAPAIAAAADETAVEAFTAGFVGFGDIPRIIERTLRDVPPGAADGLEAILAADAEARSVAGGLTGKPGGVDHN